MAGDAGAIRGPAADGRAAAAAQDDIAGAAAAVLQDPGSHADRACELAGPQSLMLAEVAATLTAAAGRTVTCQPETAGEAHASRRAACHAPGWQPGARVPARTAIAGGSPAAVTSAIPDLTGHPATSLAQLLQGPG